VKPRFSYEPLVRWGIPVGIILVLIAPYTLNMLINWDLERASERMHSLAKDLEAEAQEANPVGSTKRQVEDWLKVKKLGGFVLISGEREVDSCLRYLNISVNDTTSYIESHRRSDGGDLGI
jgi:hypothetical protein